MCSDGPVTWCWMNTLADTPEETNENRFCERRQTCWRCNANVAGCRQHKDSTVGYVSSSARAFRRIDSIEIYTREKLDAGAWTALELDPSDPEINMGGKSRRANRGQARTNLSDRGGDQRTAGGRSGRHQTHISS